MKTHSGFTLVELMITLAIAAILLTVGIPSFQNVLQNNRLATQANSLVGALNLARSEAIKRGADISITAASGGFQNGWCVHLGDGCGSATDNLRQFDAMSQMSVNSGGVTTLVFNGRGYKTTPNAAVAIRLQPQDCSTGDAGRARIINISNTGRASVSTGACS
ncbi:MAG: GspH/FimT family pseudopilin [Gammaproteobacteria bacterium]|nr:GspH/FimT family pseudopilin [Gammaproteobacteria bacterium]